MSKLKLLITGASGLIGSAFLKLYSEDYEIFAIYHRNKPLSKGIQYFKLNLLNTKELNLLVDRIKPDVILHLAALSSVSYCEQHPAMAHHINVYVTAKLDDLSKKMNIPIIFTSSDLVFNGNNAPYDESDFTYPLSQYALQKETAENILLENNKKAIIARMPLIFGIGPEYHMNFFKICVNALMSNETIQVYADEIRSAINVQTASRYLNDLILYSISNNVEEHLFHTGGSIAISRFEFYKITAETLNLSSELVKSVMINDSKRPKDLTLISEKVKKYMTFDIEELKTQIREAMNFHSY